MATEIRWFARDTTGSGKYIALTIVDGFTTWTEHAAIQLLTAAGFTETEERP